MFGGFEHAIFDVESERLRLIAAVGGDDECRVLRIGATEIDMFHAVAILIKEEMVKAVTRGGLAIPDQKIAVLDPKSVAAPRCVTTAWSWRKKTMFVKQRFRGVGSFLPIHTEKLCRADGMELIALLDGRWCCHRRKGKEQGERCKEITH